MSGARRKQAEGTTTYTEWMLEIDRGDSRGWQPSPHPKAPYICTDRAGIDLYARGIVKPKRLVHRTVQTGPWVPDPTAGG